MTALPTLGGLLALPGCSAEIPAQQAEPPPPKPMSCSPRALLMERATSHSKKRTGFGGKKKELEALRRPPLSNPAEQLSVDHMLRQHDVAFNSLSRDAMEQLNRGSPHEALRLLNMALALRPSCIQTMYSIACLHGVLGDTASASEWLLRAVQRTPPQDDAGESEDRGDCQHDRFLRMIRDTKAPAHVRKRVRAGLADDDDLRRLLQGVRWVVEGATTCDLPARWADRMHCPWLRQRIHTRQRGAGADVLALPGGGNRTTGDLIRQEPSQFATAFMGDTGPRESVAPVPTYLFDVGAQRLQRRRSTRAPSMANPAAPQQGQLQAQMCPESRSSRRRPHGFQPVRRAAVDGSAAPLTPPGEAARRVLKRLAVRPPARLAGKRRQSQIGTGQVLELPQLAGAAARVAARPPRAASPRMSPAAAAADAAAVPADAEPAVAAAEDGAAGPAAGGQSPRAPQSPSQPRSDRITTPGSPCRGWASAAHSGAAATGRGFPCFPTSPLLRSSSGDQALPEAQPELRPIRKSGAQSPAPQPQQQPQQQQRRQQPRPTAKVSPSLAAARPPLPRVESRSIGLSVAPSPTGEKHPHVAKRVSQASVSPTREQ
eukprot:TRINITY_DN10776_c1_g1_i1.p1 TRINITY_DN10776_c1_g1~~TRINITY_DN10776_c1_g1_i1.p1  ORF type:complete len:621 (+),score=158.89 TRINITY_DN10776_c1_g1_i1:62-1864(+)